VADVITFALAIPHTPWIPARTESFRRLHDQIAALPVPAHRVFDDRAPNRVWSQQMWRWSVSTGATHLVQLQDDVIVSPNFWPALRAMVEAQPDRLIGLHANHPLSVVQFKAGRRWYRDAWLTGPAYVFPTKLLASAFLPWCDEHPRDVEVTNEDSLVCKWASETKTSVWHPVPTITDVDLGVPSTYGNDAHHEWSMFRTPAVTWRDAPSLAALEDANYWRCVEEAAPLLPGPGTQKCWFCTDGEGIITSPKTGGRMCKLCLVQCVGAMVNR
jgi:hypothetical protein